MDGEAELERLVEQRQQAVRDIEIEIEPEDGAIPKGFSKVYTPTTEEF